MRAGEGRAPFELLVQRPVDHLARYLARCLYARGQNDDRRDAILPVGHMTRIINLGAPHQTFELDARRDLARTRRDARVCGQRWPILSEPPAESFMVGAIGWPMTSAVNQTPV